MTNVKEVSVKRINDLISVYNKGWEESRLKLYVNNGLKLELSNLSQYFRDKKGKAVDYVFSSYIEKNEIEALKLTNSKLGKDLLNGCISYE